MLRSNQLATSCRIALVLDEVSNVFAARHTLLGQGHQLVLSNVHDDIGGWDTTIVLGSSTTSGLAKVALQALAEQVVDVFADDEFRIRFEDGMRSVDDTNNFVSEESLDNGPLQEPVHGWSVDVDWKVRLQLGLVVSVHDWRSLPGVHGHFLLGFLLLFRLLQLLLQGQDDIGDKALQVS